MSAIGAGVTLDAATPPLRIAFYDETHADAQNDGNGNYEYNYNKIWACMGRNGVNGVLRAGFVEIGDVYNNAPAGWIEQFTGGVWGGVNSWNSNTVYNPTGGLGVGDYCVFGTLEPHTDILLHLGAALGAQPSVNIEYWNGAAWTAHTVTRTPDFTQANGRVNQRLTITLPNGWTANQPAGSAAPVPYYFTRIYTTVAYGVGPQANNNYRDFFEGHMQMFYCHYALKRGNDTTTDVSATSFRHVNPVVLKFRSNFGWETRSTITTPMQFGSRTLVGKDYVSGHPWVIFGGKQSATFRPADFYGGMFALRGRHGGEVVGPSVQGLSPAGRLLETVFAGAPDGYSFGGQGSTALISIDDVMVRRDPSSNASGSALKQLSTDNTVGRVTNLKAAGMGLETNIVASSAASVKIQGVRIVGTQSGRQISLSGGGLRNIYEPQWANSGTKTGAGADPPSQIREWWFCFGFISNKTTGLGVILPFRITDALGQKQADDLTGADGKTSYQNLLTSAPTGGAFFLNRICASEWRTSATPELETVLDPLFIEINPTDHASYNASYESMVIRTSFPNPVVWDNSLGDYTSLTYQRMNMSWSVSLGPPATPAAPPTIITTDALPLVVNGVERVFLPIGRRS